MRGRALRRWFQVSSGSAWVQVLLMVVCFLSVVGFRWQEPVFGAGPEGRCGVFGEGPLYVCPFCTPRFLHTRESVLERIIDNSLNSDELKMPIACDGHNRCFAGRSLPGLGVGRSR